MNDPDRVGGGGILIIMDIFVARQPIFTKSKKIFGYELLFRDGLQNAFPDIDGDTATSKLLSNTFFSFGIGEITGDKPGFVNFTKDLILQKVPNLFPQKSIVIEVLENIEPDEQIIDSLEEIKRKGYIIALDDFIFEEKFRPFIELASIIKFDLFATPLDSLESIIEDINSKYELTLLAEKVETHEEFEKAIKMGFTLFQGYFFSKPEILSEKDISANQLIRLQLIAEVNKKKLDLVELAKLIKTDIAISFKLLKFINCAYFKRPHPINTIKEAMTYMGTDELRKFISLVAVSSLNDSKPLELMRLSVIRARMCELIGTVMKTDFTSEELFTLGLFSLIDAILDKEMSQILPQTSFSEKISYALMGNDKKFTNILNAIILIEKGDWENKFFKLIEGTKLYKNLPKFYLDSVKMAESLADSSTAD